MGEDERLKEAIQSEYGGVARQVLAQLGEGKELPMAQSACCSPAPGPGAAAADSCCSGDGAAACCSPVAGYGEADLQSLPDGARQASRGCGNPVALAALEPGQVVLDLGAGGGIDVLLAADRVGPAGKVYGLDMTEDMLVLARANARRAGVANVEFIRGEIEQIPLPANSVDVIISNCVINLTLDKGRALAEAYRVLRPGGRLAVSDIVFPGDPAAVPAAWRKSAELWAGCVSGALGVDQYRSLLAAVGFTDIDVALLWSQRVAGVEIGSAAVTARKPA